ncbi:MAG: hypothetical protein GY710_07400 [Desulfobacteraceae bacterium]|nr:hypothetical protein [Desulfobacteraceae bacterium]
MNTLVDSNSLINFIIKQKSKKNFWETPIIKYRDLVQDLKESGTIPDFSDYFDFLRENQSRGYDFFTFRGCDD